MSQAELPRDLNAQPADEVTEKYWQLIRQNRAFLSCANRRDKIWEGNCSGCDRDRADGKKGRGSVGGAIASGLFHDHRDVGRSQTARSSYTDQPARPADS